MTAMNEFMVIQGRQLKNSDIDFIRQLIQDNSSWNRTGISKEICKHWDWRRPNGQLKDMACRTMLRKLQARELITLPKPLHSGHHQRKIIEIPHATEPVQDPLSALRPIRLTETHSSRNDDDLFCYLLNRYHYLGLRATFSVRISAIWPTTFMGGHSAAYCLARRPGKHNREIHTLAGML